MRNLLQSLRTWLGIATSWVCGLYGRNRLRIWLTVLSAAIAGVTVYAALLSGDAAGNAQSVLMGNVRLSYAVLWYFVAGWLNDFSNGVGFNEDKKLIDGGNVAVALKRCVGFAVVYGAGCVLIATI